MFKKNKSQMEVHASYLGYKARDYVTGFEGVITSLSFDLYGCVQYVITPPVKDHEIANGHWFDVTRVEILSDTAVMRQPDFDKGYVAEGKKGSADKPLP